MNETLHLPSVEGFFSNFIRRNKTEASSLPVIEGAVRHPHGPFVLHFRLAKNCAYEIQASSDLQTWLSVGTGSADNTEVTFVDSDAPKFSHRFYRILSGVLQSADVFGCASISVPPGFSMIANPLDGISNSVAGLFPNLPDGAALSKFDSMQFKLTTTTVKNGRWSNPSETLAPGEGGLFFNPKDSFMTLDFVGKVIQGSLLNPIPAGFSIRSSILPRPGRLDTDLEFPLSEGDTVYIFDRDRQAYNAYPYPDESWKKNPPVIGMGESFWVEKGQAKNWICNFSV